MIKISTTWRANRFAARIGLRTCSPAANYMQKKGDLNNMHACGLSADLLDRKLYR